MKSKSSRTDNESLSINISLKERPDFKNPLSAYLFDTKGNLLANAVVKKGVALLSVSDRQLTRNRFFIAPTPQENNDVVPTLELMEKRSAYEPVITIENGEIKEVVVPGPIIDVWPLCFCHIKGRLLQQGSDRSICGAKVHICEIDKVWRWIIKLPDYKIFRLRDDLIKEIERLRKEPPIPIPGPDPGPIIKWPFRFAQNISELGPQPEPPDLPQFKINPQPEPPGNIKFYQRSNAGMSFNRASEVGFNPQPEPPIFQFASLTSAQVSLETITALKSTSAQVVREALIENVKLILPYLCLWPHWWTFHCDHIATVTTDHLGRFDAYYAYPCNGDRPDIYIWVEYEINGVLETVYKPPIACATRWNYICGSEILIRIDDERIPACDDEPDLPGCQVAIISIGRNISIAEIENSGTNEGLTTNGEPLGGKIEPRVWFSRSELLTKGISYYRWSYRRLTDQDGNDLLVSDDDWKPLNRDVVRHYAVIGSGGGVTFEPFTLGPKSVGGETNLFQFKPAMPPAPGIEWYVVDEREDLASAHFETTKLPHGLPASATACQKALQTAGKYELKLELFKNNGDLVDWTAAGIDLRVTDIAAPFGTHTVTTVSAGNLHRLLNSSLHTMAFKMVLMVDNSCCQADIKPVSGTGLSFNSCGFIEYSSGATITLEYQAYHPHGFADFSFSLKRGVAPVVSSASASGQTGVAIIPTNDASGVYVLQPSGNYQITLPVASLLGPCPKAAFSEALHIWARATDGYGRLHHLDSSDHAAFALDTPCPPCNCAD